LLNKRPKASWKSPKSREGIVTQRDALSCSTTLSDPHNAPQSSVGHEGQGAPVDEPAGDQHGDESQNSSKDEPAPALTKSEQNLRGQGGSTGAGPSLRELQKQAYSPATLHHYKSRPLQHSKGRIAPHGTRTPESSRKRGVGEGSRNTSRREGQPDIACACPPCWRRSNGTIHDRRSVRSTSASASKEGGWLIGTRQSSSVEKDQNSDRCGTIDI
jgi:hypothetical protein